MKHKITTVKINYEIAIIGGCGHVGLPLGIALADAGFKTNLIDINKKAINLINNGTMPFLEEEIARTTLNKVIANNLLVASNDIYKIKSCNIVIFVTGTPIDEYLNPRIHDIINVIKTYLPYLNSKQLIILRSTVFPGVIDIIDHLLTKKLGEHKLSFCPERIAQGYGLSEIKQLPQIISATSKQAEDEAADLFSHIVPKVIRLNPQEAEFAKLMTNTWRYLEFGIANQFYLMAESNNLDFYKIFDALRADYPRAKYFATPGFAAGPCLFKDTMQLSAFHEGKFFIGHAAMLVNEGLPIFLVKQLEKKIGLLRDKKIAILGMAFKANNDDTRESLSFKLKKALESKMATVLASDIYDKSSIDYNDAIAQANAVILGVPHKEYLDLDINKPFIDCWGVWRERIKY